MNVAERVARPFAAAGVRARTRAWAPVSRLFVVGDGSGWSIDDDAVQLEATARRLGVPLGPAGWAPHARGQAVFLPSHFSALRTRWLGSSHRIGLAYFHGRPGTAGHPEFDEALAALRRNAARVDRVQVTHAEMHELVVAAGVDTARVFRIPIGIDVRHFPLVDEGASEVARRELGLPRDAFVVGSFQKDGLGWDDGLVPKLVKGPDVLVETLRRARERVPELVVLLTGPARGYVLGELARYGIRAVHHRPGDRAGLVGAYNALDAYVVASRPEGGPKSAFEALATGVPLVSTRVGQTRELVPDGAALFADADDAETLAAQLVRVYEDDTLGPALRARGRPAAEALDYPLLDPLWAELLQGFVER